MNLETRRIVFALLPVVIPLALAIVLVALPPQALLNGHLPIFGPNGGGRGIAR